MYGSKARRERFRKALGISPPSLEQEALQRQPGTDVLLQVAERVVGELEEPCPPRLAPRRIVEQAPPEVQLPAAQGELDGLLDAPVGGSPLEVGGVELGRQGERRVRRCAEDLIQPLTPVFVALDDPLLPRGLHRPARA